MIITSEKVVAKVQEAFNFTVDKFPLGGPDKLTTPWYGLFRSDNSKVLGKGSVTKIYCPHQTDDVLALVDGAAHAFDGEIDVRCHFRDGHYVSIIPTKDYRRQIYGGQDNIFPRVLIRACYDGQAFSATMGYYRDLCRNMSMMRQVSGTSVSIKHTSGLRNKMDELIKTFATLKESWQTLGNIIETLENREVQMVDFLNQVYGEPARDATARSINMHSKRTETIFRRLQRERTLSGRPAIGDSFKVSAWEAYNGIQGYVQHDATRRGEPSDFARMLIASNDKAVTTAETLVLALAS